jgi:phage terminase small subunit
MADEKGASAAVAAVMGKAKLHGLLIEKNEHTGKGGAPIEVRSLADFYSDHKPSP